MTQWSDQGPGPQEGFIRPDHNDFKTTAELKEAGFTGTRANSLTGDFEFWFFGEIVKIVTAEIRESDPAAIYKAHKELFRL